MFSMDEDEQLSVPDAMIMMDSATVVEMTMGSIGTVMVLVPGNSERAEKANSLMLAKLAMATGNAIAQLVRIENIKKQKRATQTIEKLKMVKKSLPDIYNKQPIVES